MMRHWHGGWTGGEWVLAGVGMLLFWALVVAGVIWLVRHLSADRRSSGERGVPLDKPVSPDRPSAREILDERYARGEIGDEEYRTRRDTLAGR
jgi:putative membrane protein